MVSYVYLIWLKGTSLYKIGKADDPSKRLKRLQTGQPGELLLLGQISCKDALRKEFYLHSKYKRYRVQGEWFDIPPLELKELFAEFKFHTEETQDTPIYYWASKAQAWQDVAISGLEQLERFSTRLNNTSAFASGVHDAELNMLLRMFQELPPEMVEHYAKELSMQQSETHLIAKQVGII